jgi:urocanate hydratase
VIGKPEELVRRIKDARQKKEAVSIAYQGNVVEVWETLLASGVHVDLGSDQTSLHNPWAGGYYPAAISFGEANEMMASRPEEFKRLVQESLRRQAIAINKHTAKGTYFFDYGNAFLLEASRAGADRDGSRWHKLQISFLRSGYHGTYVLRFRIWPFPLGMHIRKQEDLDFTDAVASQVLEELLKESSPEIQSQLSDNIRWIHQAKENKLVVGSKARILYADANGRIRIAEAFNKAVREGKIGYIVLGRDHHDVSGTIAHTAKPRTFTTGQSSRPTWLYRMLLAIHSGEQPGYQSTTAGEWAGAK